MERSLAGRQGGVAVGTPPQGLPAWSRARAPPVFSHATSKSPTQEGEETSGRREDETSGDRTSRAESRGRGFARGGRGRGGRGGPVCRGCVAPDGRLTRVFGIDQSRLASSSITVPPEASVSRSSTSSPRGAERKKSARP